MKEPCALRGFCGLEDFGYFCRKNILSIQKMKHYIPVLSIGESDPSGATGVQADIKTISSTGCYAMAAVTALTARDKTYPVDAETVKAQLDMAMKDIRPMAVKVGALSTTDNVAAVADALDAYKAENVVLDPAIDASAGRDYARNLLERLVPLAAIVTPDSAEAEALTGEKDSQKQIEALRDFGARAVLLKGGDRDDRNFAIDILSLPGEEPLELRADRVNTKNTLGTGTSLASAIASFLALGFPMVDAVKAAKSYITRALISGAAFETGRGAGPVNHLFAPRKTKLK